MEYIAAKTILSGYSSGNSWFGINYNMNIYKGCCHGCIYCDSRSECYGIENFDQVRAKVNALAILRDELRRKVKTGVVGTGAMSDPYNPFEQKQLLTRHSLELLDAFGFGAAIATKSTLITRDIDILQDIRDHSPVLCKITITTADDSLSRIIEPLAPPSSERFEAVRTLSEAGLFTGILLMPVLPFLTDTEDNIRSLVQLTAQSGGRFITGFGDFGVTLRANQRSHYYQQLDSHFPGVKQKYIERYGNTYHCTCPAAKRLFTVFRQECEKHGILYQLKDIIRAYKRGYDYEQMNLFS